MGEQNRRYNTGNLFEFVGHIQGEGEIIEGIVCDIKYDRHKHTQRFVDNITYFGVSEDRMIESIQTGEPVNKEGLIVTEYRPTIL